jgi:WD40 repeat protein
LVTNQFQAHASSINRIKQSPFANKYVATVSSDSTAKIWDLTASNTTIWTLIRTFKGHGSELYDCEFVSKSTIATCALGGHIKIWSLSTGFTSLVIVANTAAYSLKLLTNDLYLAAGLANGKINIYDLNNGSLIETLIGHTSFVFNLVQINSDLLASSSDDKTVRIWNLATFTCKFNLTGHTSFVAGLKQINSDLLASGSGDSTIKLWNVTSGRLVNTLSGHTSWIQWSVDVINNVGYLLSGSSDQTMNIWDWQTGQILNTISTTIPIRSLVVLNTTTLTSKFIFGIFLQFSIKIHIVSLPF